MYPDHVDLEHLANLLSRPGLRDAAHQEAGVVDQDIEFSPSFLIQGGKGTSDTRLVGDIELQYFYARGPQLFDNRVRATAHVAH